MSTGGNTWTCQSGTRRTTLFSSLSRGWSLPRVTQSTSGRTRFNLQLGRREGYPTCNTWQRSLRVSLLTWRSDVCFVSSFGPQQCLFVLVSFFTILRYFCFSAPSDPRDVKVWSDQHDKLSISWTKPLHENGVVGQYKVKITERPQTFTRHRCTKSGEPPVFFPIFHETLVKTKRKLRLRISTSE